MQNALQARHHADRLRQDLREIRAELTQVVRELAPAGLDWAPRPDMRSVKHLLQEIGAMEEINRLWAAHQQIGDWKAIWQSLDKDNVESTLSALEAVRTETLTYLDGCTEEQLQTPIPLPETWQQYFEGASVIEPEELLRWVARHEYYHLGQLITYSFLRAPGPSPQA